MLNFAINIIANIYSKIFKEKSGPATKEFIKKVIFIFIGTGIAKSIILVFNLIGGRVTGPEIYGKFSLILSVTEILVIPIGIGVLTGVIKNLAETPDLKNRKSLISTAFNFQVLTILILIPLYYLFHGILSSALKIEPTVFILAIILSIFWSFNTLSETILQGLHRQVHYAIFLSISHIIPLFVFVYFLIIDNTELMILYLPFILVLFLFSIISLISTKKFIKIGLISKKHFHKLFEYGIIAFFLYILTTFLGNVDRIMINYLLATSDLGIYQAYYTASISIVGILAGVFIKVLFPTAVKLKDPKGFTKKLDKLSLISFPIILLVSPAIIWIFLYIYNYPFSLMTAALFAIATTIDLIVVLYSTLLNAQGTQFIKKTLIGLGVAFLVNIPLNYVLIGWYGINGAIMSTGFSFFLLFVYLRYSLSKIKEKKK